MRRYLKYVLLGIVISFTFIFVVLFGINMHMSKSKIVLSENTEYENKLKEVEERLNSIVEVNSCVDSIVEFKDLSKETYFIEDMKTEEWVRLFYNDTYQPLKLLSSIIKNCELNTEDSNDIISSYLLVFTTYDKITSDALYNYELSFSDVFFRELSEPNISSFSYRMAKLQELYIIDNILNNLEGDNND